MHYTNIFGAVGHSPVYAAEAFAPLITVLLAGVTLSVAAMLAYLVIASMEFHEAIAAYRAKQPYVRKLVKTFAHVVLFLKLLLV